MDMMTLLLLMTMTGGRRTNMLPLILMMMFSGGGSTSLATTSGSMPINFQNAMMWSMMPRMGTLPAMLTGGLDAVIGQSMFKTPARRRRSYAPARRYRRRRYY